MGHRFAELAFTQPVRDVQEALGSRAHYAALEEGPDSNHVLSEREAAFIQARDSFYMASVGETGWPYLQHRGGPIGFVRVLDHRRIGFADFRGNRQYVSVGNVRHEKRVALFFMDYPNQVRLKVLGRAELVDLASERLVELEVPDYRARVERGFIIHIEAFDWNCPQHITARYTQLQVEQLIAPVIEENRALKATCTGACPSRPRSLGQGPLELIISGVRQLTPRVRAYELRDAAGTQLPPVEAGAHLRVPVRLESDRTVLRHYSICSDPSWRDAYEIAVLREDAGTGGSRGVHETFGIGLHLRCDFPENKFPLHAGSRPSLLIAGGIGITPILSMARALKARGAPFRLHYAARSGPDMAFKEQVLREFSRETTLYSSADGERMDIERILATASIDAMIYVCGPARLIDAVGRAAASLHIPPDRIRLERFVAHVHADSRPIVVELRSSGKRLNVRADQTILDAMLDAGIDATYSCRAGTCKTCSLKVLAGEPDHRDSVLTPAEREQQALMCPCISRARGEFLALDV